ncbi:hypothetical protein [Paenibacillus tuaregi]|uniref:hypothetical protein n=1 Tax=Paenibacillus tuaregi TaxID=1816681 RepID=UPI000B2385C8|nr:hypothetical protein [Paenibacillus tuaregi]
MTIILMTLIFVGAVVVPLIIIEVNRRREITSEFNQQFFGYSCLTLGMQVVFLLLFLTDKLQGLGMWAHAIWWWIVLSGLYVAVVGIWKKTRNRKNVVLFLLTGGISVILGILYLLGVLITSM